MFHIMAEGVSDYSRDGAYQSVGVLGNTVFERTGPTRCCACLLPKVTYVKIVWCNSADLNIKVTMNGTAKRFRIVQLLRKEGLGSELRRAQQHKWPKV